MNQISNREIGTFIEQLLRRFNPGSESSAFDELNQFNWNELDNLGYPVGDCRDAVIKAIFGINPNRNAHEILVRVQQRLNLTNGVTEDHYSSDNQDIKLHKRSSPEMESKVDEKILSAKSRKMESLKRGPPPPLSPVQCFTAKTCERKGMDEGSKNKPQWKELFMKLKPEKKYKFIKQAITDELRYQEECKEIDDPKFEPLPQFSQISKKDLEFFLQCCGLNKVVNSGYHLFITECMQSSDGKDKDKAMSARMKDYAAEWKLLSDYQKEQYNSRHKVLSEERKSSLASGSPEIIAVDHFLRKTGNSTGSSKTSSQKLKKQSQLPFSQVEAPEESNSILVPPVSPKKPRVPIAAEATSSILSGSSPKKLKKSPRKSILDEW